MFGDTVRTTGPSASAIPAPHWAGSRTPARGRGLPRGRTLGAALQRPPRIHGTDGRKGTFRPPTEPTPHTPSRQFTQR